MVTNIGWNSYGARVKTSSDCPAFSLKKRLLCVRVNKNTTQEPTLDHTGYFGPYDHVGSVMATHRVPDDVKF